MARIHQTSSLHAEFMTVFEKHAGKVAGNVEPDGSVSHQSNLAGVTLAMRQRRKAKRLGQRRAQIGEA